ncbi:hypothetical protein CHH28_08870 [Bacterioplanes sanyensis]|uniref:Uncharacterized protein n=1 Tax=Bacterioplanes sanyensis TaxID=1249553 RepID=A0A222FIB3_9GAMM|nr:hypothetical protein CHH28_08870 [Bacterioplanes sanyensis]
MYARVSCGYAASTFPSAGEARHAFLAGLPVFPWGGSLNGLEISESVLGSQSIEVWIVGEYVFSRRECERKEDINCKSIAWKRYLE